MTPISRTIGKDQVVDKLQIAWRSAFAPAE